MSGNKKDVLEGLSFCIIFTVLFSYILTVESSPKNPADFLDVFLMCVFAISCAFLIGGLTLWFVGDNPRGVSIVICSGSILIVIIAKLIIF